MIAGKKKAQKAMVNFSASASQAHLSDKKKDEKRFALWYILLRFFPSSCALKL